MASARQNSPSGDLDDFWQEFKDIESSKQTNGEEEELAKTPDGTILPLMRQLQQKSSAFLVC